MGRSGLEVLNNRFLELFNALQKQRDDKLEAYSTFEIQELGHDKLEAYPTFMLRLCVLPFRSCGLAYPSTMFEWTTRDSGS
jgi:hypothetical protein